MRTFLPKGRESRYVRVTIPLTLRHFFDERCELWRSTGTSHKELASVRAARWSAAGQSLFLTLRQRGRHMQKSEIDQLVANWIESELDEAEDYRTLNGPFISGGAGSWVLLNDAREDFKADLATGDYSRIEHEAVELLKSAGVTLDAESADFKRLCRRLLLARIEFLEIESERWNGHYRDSQ